MSVKINLNLKTKFYEMKQGLKEASTLGISLRLRLFLFLLVLVITMVLFVLAILLLTGIFSTGQNESKKLVQSMLSYTNKEITEHYGSISARAVDFSRGLAKNIENNLDRQGLNVTDLDTHPEILETLVEYEYERLLFSLQKTKSSGIFMILDTTINPDLKNAEYSRTGLFIKNMEPDIVSSTTPTIAVLRGFPGIARKNALPLHTQWAMEFEVSEASYFRLPMEQAANKSIPLSRLYYWSPALTLPGYSEEVMLCSVPLIDSKGNVFGVCGFEVSAMLFKLAYLPDNSNFGRIFSMLAPLKDNNLQTSKALFSGKYRVLSTKMTDNSLNITQNRVFNTYSQEGNAVFLGLHEPVQLYPKGSPFINQKWAIAILVPKEDITAVVAHNNRKLALGCLLLIVIGIISSSFISKRYIKPITQGLNIIKSVNLTDVPKIKISEIDDLIEFLSTNNKKIRSKSAVGLSETVFNEFVDNIKTLSPAEKAVFDLYVQGYTAKEITQILCLSINTIKTHNKRIYMKLNVASREDLLKYVNKLKQMGKDLK
jgi:Response regulator containing a CheY-like receiver domain and an HTH DNA-binding domain